jgi:transcriptional regulator with XRE-family HTH domain
VQQQVFDDEARRRELADFLKARRKRLTPRTARVHERTRRLASGLRREEVAERAGVGLTWYTWLEQARDIRPSEITLLRISRALQLTAVEKKYLLDVALERRVQADRDEVPSPVLLSIVNGISSPAVVTNRLADVVAYNAAANALLDLDYAPTLNTLQYLFTPQARAMHPYWPKRARQGIGLFRARNAGRLGQPAVAKVLSTLTQQSEHFRAWWAEQEVEEMNSGRLIYRHPFAGELSFDYELLRVLESPSLTVQVQVCHGAETRERFEKLLRQQRNGEHSAAHNLWTALAPCRVARSR